jgi:two-component system sensor kinase FixL
MRSFAGFRGGRLRFAVVVGYVALFVLLDWASLIDRSSPLGITPWNPPAGLSFALLLYFGWRFAPAVFAAVLLSDLVVREVRASAWAVPLAAGLIAGGYALAAEVLRRNVRVSPALDRRNDLVALLGVALAAASAIAPAAVAVFCAAGLLPWRDFAELALRFWVGDVLGIVVLAPFLLLTFAEVRRWPALARHETAIEYGLQLAAIGAGLWIIFGLERANHFEFSYVLFLPLIWIALRDGLFGAAWGIVATQVGVIVAIRLKGFDTETVTQFQFLMLAVAVTGFFLGGVVDQRRRAERDLRDSEARLQTILSTAPDAILTYEEDGRIASANRAATAMFGAGRRALTGMPISGVLPHVGAASAAGTIETTARRTDGSAFTAEVSVGRAELEGRALNVAVVRDVTDRERAEAALKQHEMRLAHAARLTAAGEMAAGLAHELNQPLAAAISFARACEDVLKAPPERLAEVRGEAGALIGEAVQQALRAGEIVRRTREFLRRGELHPRAIDVAELFRTVLGLARSEISVQRVAVATEIAPGLPPVYADPIQIEQVLLNLLRNGIEEMARAGSAERNIQLSARAAEDGMIEFAVADSGPGIPAGLEVRIFTPFVTSKETGMGLGLSLSRSIVESHGGRLWFVARAPGTGAEFRFTLPAHAGRGENRDGA